MNPLGDFPNKLPIEDALDLGWKVSVMGIAIVFLALVCLIILTIVYPKVFGWILPKSRACLDRWADKRAARKFARVNKKAAKKLLSNEVVVAKTKVEPVISEDVQRSTDNQELIAVISAAVAASLGTSSNGIRIRSIKRSGSNTPAWGRKGRLEQFKF